MSDDLLIKVQDSFPPSVTISSPSDDSYYYSRISITGCITDSALAANDGIGELASISYTVANDVSRRGKINFADDGSFINDTSFGSGDIVYDRETVDYTITFSTIEADGVANSLTRRVNITVTAVDKNNNSSEKTVRFPESEGPYINLVEPGTTIYYFSAGSYIIIS